MEVYNKDGVIIEAYVSFKESIVLHEINGEEYTIDVDDISRVRVYDGKTYIGYYTGWDDCPEEGFYVTETPEEVKKLMEKAIEVHYDNFEKFKISPVENK